MNRTDLIQVGKVAALAIVAWSIPPRLWRTASATLSHFGSHGTDPSFYQRVLGPAWDAKACSILDYRRLVCRREGKLQNLGLIGTWRSWCPDIRFHGEAELQKALNNGKGAILWITESAYSSLIFKMALHRAGYRASQLSRPSHGYSASPFGIKFLNPLWTTVEDRFIAERVTIHNDNATSALAILRARLAANRVVIITVNSLAHKFVEAPFFQDFIRVPTGPMRLMQETGAALLPAFAFAANSTHFDVTIERALPSADSEGTFNTAATVYSKRLESYVRAYPEQWTGWDFMLAKI
jgi:lauroyl/myristoyl acyltransferase